MGKVYHGRDTKLGREVAIKLLPGEVASDPERPARFRREAKLLAALNHPSIGALYGIEETDQHGFLVMELADGDSYLIAISDESQQATAGRRGVKVAQNWTAKLER